MNSPSPRGLFVTGTDTGVGKTLVTAAVVYWLRAEGLDAVPMKPVQTGCTGRAGYRRAPDVDFALRANGMTADAEELHRLAPYCLRLPCSPHLAAKEEHVRISLPVIGCHLKQVLRRHDFAVVEGAGGVCVPLSPSASMLDLMVSLALPVLLVTRPGLGTLNHTQLSLRAIRQAGLTLAGVVINHAGDGRIGPVERDNEMMIRKMAGAASVAVLPYCRKTAMLRLQLALKPLAGRLQYIAGICS